MAKAAIIDRSNAPYGIWAVTQAEYQRARELAALGDEQAFQLVRYCQGSIFYRDEAIKALQDIRGALAPELPSEAQRTDAYNEELVRRYSTGQFLTASDKLEAKALIAAQKRA